MATSDHGIEDDEIGWWQDNWEKVKNQEHLFLPSSRSSGNKAKSKIKKRKTSTKAGGNNAKSVATTKDSGKYFSRKLYFKNLIEHVEEKYCSNEISLDQPEVNFKDKDMTWEKSTLEHLEAMPVKEFGESIDFHLEHTLAKSYVDSDDQEKNDCNIRDKH